MNQDIQRLHVAARYSEAAIFNGVVYLAGMVPECEAADIRSQTADVLRQIEQRLAEAGSDKTRILRTQIYLKDITDIAAMNEVWDAWVVAGSAPPRATVQAALADPAYRIEVVVTAAVKAVVMAAVPAAGTAL
jgi:enamine deaminase RidA (YjgF/YER057c/UK114 family)